MTRRDVQRRGMNPLICNEESLGVLIKTHKQLEGGGQRLLLTNVGQLVPACSR